MRLHFCLDLCNYLLSRGNNGGIEELQFWFLFALLVAQVLLFRDCLFFVPSFRVGPVGVFDYLFQRGSSSVYFQACEWLPMLDEIRLFHLLPELSPEFCLIPGFGGSCYREDAGGFEC